MNISVPKGSHWICSFILTMDYNHLTVCCDNWHIDTLQPVYLFGDPRATSDSKGNSAWSIKKSKYLNLIQGLLIPAMKWHKVQHKSEHWCPTFCHLHTQCPCASRKHNCALWTQGCVGLKMRCGLMHWYYLYSRMHLHRLLHNVTDPHQFTEPGVFNSN